MDRAGKIFGLAHSTQVVTGSCGCGGQSCILTAASLPLLLGVVRPQAGR